MKTSVSLFRFSLVTILLLGTAVDTRPADQLYIKDNTADTGGEGNTTTTTFWESPDISIRQNPISGYSPQPFKKSAVPAWVATAMTTESARHRDTKLSTPNYIYVRVRHLGSGASSTGLEHLRVYFAKASLGLTWPASFQNNVLTVCGVQRLVGDEVTKPRKNAASATTAEKDAYRDAILALDAVSGGGLALRRYINPGSLVSDDVSFWDKQDQIHERAPLHRTPGFLPWHREYISQYEALLREVKPELTLLYWDWQTDPGPLFTATFMGASGRGTALGSRVGAPFSSLDANWNCSLSRITASGAGIFENSFERPSVANCLTTGGGVLGDWRRPPPVIHRRVFNGNPITAFAPFGLTFHTDGAITGRPFYYDPTFDSQPATGPLPAPTANNQMSYTLEVGAHNLSHGFFEERTPPTSTLPRSNQFATPTGAEDPFFFLLHANCDRIWAKWQRNAGANADRIDALTAYAGPSGGATTHGDITTPMRPWSGSGTAIFPWQGLPNDYSVSKSGTHPSVLFPPIYDDAMLNIPALDNDEDVVIEIPWYPPNPDDFNCGPEPGHFCLVARIETSPTFPFGMTTGEGTDISANAQANNNVAWKNISVISQFAPCVQKKANVIVAGPPQGSAIAQLRITVPPQQQAESFFIYGRVFLRLDETLFARWTSAGRRGQQIELVDANNRIIEVKSNNSVVEGLGLNATEQFPVEVQFELKPNYPSPGGQQFQLTIQQEHITGQTHVVIGGQTFTLDFNRLFLVMRGASWRYWDDVTPPDGDWKFIGFNDAEWKSGRADLGFGDNSATAIGQVAPSKGPVAFYFRHVFPLADTTGLRNMWLHLKRDDGAVVYLNGQEVYRVNLPDGQVTHQTTANRDVNGVEEQAFFPVDLTSHLSLLRSNQNLLAVELHRTSPRDDDLGFDAELTVNDEFPQSPPVLQLTATPANAHLQLGTNIPIVIDALDPDGKILGVAVSVDGILIGEDSDPPYEVPWQEPTPGRHTIQVDATDDAGLSSFTIANVLVVSNLPPRVALTAPHHDADIVGPSFIVAADVSDVSDAISEVTFFLTDGSGFGGDTVASKTLTAPPYATSLPSPAPGDHYILFAIAKDARGAIGGSASMHLRVMGPPAQLVSGQWDFERGDLSATVGVPLEYRGGTGGPTAAATRFGSTRSFDIPDISGIPANVLCFAGATNSAIGFIAHHGIAPNAGGTNVNQWTLIMDILTPNRNAEPWLSFIQIDDTASNANDGDLFAQWRGGGAGIGISGEYDGQMVAGRWHRIAFAVDARSVISKFIDGTKVADQTAWDGVGLDGRHGLFPTALLFGDENGESQVVYVNSIQFRGYKMSDVEIEALGSPAAAGIPDPKDPFITTFYNFNDCIPPAGTSFPGTGNVGAIADDGTGTNCVVHLNDAEQGNVYGVFRIPAPADGGHVDNIHMRWRSLVGGDGGSVCTSTQFRRPGADGYSMSWGTDLPNPPSYGDPGEEGAGSGLIVTVDTFDNGDGEAPGLEIKWRGARAAFDKIDVDPGLAKDFLRKNAFVEADLTVDPAGHVTFTYDGRVITTTLPDWTGIHGGNIMFGSRTGGACDHHWIDDLLIERFRPVVTEGCPPVSITKVQLVAPESFSLSFQSRAGSFYSVEYKNSLTDAAAWTTLIHLQAQPGGLTTVNDSTADAMRFYRVVCHGTTQGGAVHASVYATVFTSPGGAARQIFLPDISVYTKNDATQVESARVPTDLNGWFPIPDQPSGLYQLRWLAPGFGGGFSPGLVSIASRTAYPQPIEIVLRTNVITGRVTFSDGQPTYFEQPFFNLAVQTTVRLVDNLGDTVAGPVRPNKSGEYVLANVPRGDFRLVAQAEAAQLVQPASTGNAQNIDLPLPNRRPRILAAYAADAGRGVRSAPPGATLTVTVDTSDPDGDPIHFLWKPTATAGGFVSTDTATVTWTIPKSGGIHTMYVAVRDNKGGYAVEKVSVSGDGEAVLFTGQVCDTDGRPINDATVVVNGQATESSGQGSFAVRLDGEANRYVLTITAPGYQLFSKVMRGGIVGGKYSLQRMQSIVVNPFGFIEVVEERPNQLGAQLEIGPNSLVDQNGNPPTGALNLSLSTLDLRDPEGRLPGDFGAVDAAGDDVGLVSYGAVEIQIQDGAGRRFNLVPGSTATLRLAVDPQQLAAGPPPQIPIWFYDASTGVWLEEGMATLNGPYYEAILAHFSTINADVAYTDAACMRLIVPSDSPLKLPFKLRVTVPTGTLPDKVFTETVADALSVISRLPANTPITLEPLDSAGNPIPLAKQIVNSGAFIPGPAQINPPYPYANCNSQAILTFGVPSNSGFLDFAGLSSADQAGAYYASIDPTSVTGLGTVASSGNTVSGSGTSFLTFFTPGDLIKVNILGVDYFRIIATVSSATTLQTSEPFPSVPANTTYEKIGIKPTLAAWKSANGFNSGDDAEAVYLNEADLGLGRWMHMKKKSGGEIAYYVSNYGVAPNKGSADIAALAKIANTPNLGLIATVAMEYSPTPSLGPDPFTKFYVFDAAGNRVDKAQLDSYAPKFIPHLCVTCHGGNYSSTSPKFGSKFLPFDVDSFGYSTLASSVSKPAQEPAFKLMNARILEMTPIPGVDYTSGNTGLSRAIEELIQGWYGGSLALGSQSLPNPTQIPTFVPPAWTTPVSPVDKSALYSQVVKESCRACHASRDPGLDFAKWTGSSPLGFKEYGSIIKLRVCTSRVMPNAEVTFNRFWLSTTPYQPAALGNGGLDNWSPSDLCP